MKLIGIILIVMFSFKTMAADFCMAYPYSFHGLQHSYGINCVNSFEASSSKSVKKQELAYMYLTSKMTEKGYSEARSFIEDEYLKDHLDRVLLFVKDVKKDFNINNFCVASMRPNSFLIDCGDDSLSYIVAKTMIFTERKWPYVDACSASEKGKNKLFKYMKKRRYSLHSEFEEEDTSYCSFYYLFEKK